MEIEYFYLDGKEQKGPFTLEQIKGVGLKSETLVWTETFESWKAAKDVPELANLLKKLPPPPPIVDNIPYTNVNIAGKQQNQKTLVEDSNVKGWVTFKVILTFSALFALAFLLGFGIVNSKKKELRSELGSKVDQILDGKTVVLDGTETGVRGKLEDTGLSEKKKKKKTDKKDLVWIKMGKDSVQFDRSGFSVETWRERDGLYTVFNCNDGGFTIKKLTKLNDDSYEIETYNSNDMGYREPEYTYGVTGWGYNENGEYNNYGNIKNDRQSIQRVYTKAFEFFTKNDKTGAYSPGKFVDITNFSDLRNDYFLMDNVEPKKYASAGHMYSSWFSTDDHTANIFTDEYRVYYSSRGYHYEVTPIDSKINKDLWTIVGIGAGVVIMLIIILMISKPRFFRNLMLFGKRWRNNVYEDQILFFTHSFFKNHQFTEIIKDNIEKGILKITDKGNTINLSYSNKELFYKIEKLEMDELRIVSLKDGTTITFSRVGSKRKPSPVAEKLELNEDLVTESSETIAPQP